MKQLKAALAAKQAAKAAIDNAQSKKARKMNPKQIATLKGLGETIVKQTIDAGDSVAALYFKLVGKTEAELQYIREGLDDAWKAALAKLKKDCAEWASKVEARDENSAYAKQAQVFYNRKSEGNAIIKFLGVLAALPKGDARKRIEKDLRDMEHAPRRYDTLVMYARHVNNPAKRQVGNKPSAQSLAVKRARNAWKNHASEQMKKAKDLLRYAPTDNLLALSKFVDSLIEARRKGGEEGANVRKLIRKAA